MASLKRDRWGNWIVRFRVGGRGTPIVRENLGNLTYKDAVEKCAEIEGRYKGKDAPPKPLSFEELAKKYLELRGDRLSKRGRALAGTIIACHLVPFFGAMRADRIRPVHVEEYRLQRRRLRHLRGRKEIERTELPISPATFNREWSLLRAILSFGYRGGLLDREPIRPGAVEMLEAKAREVFFEPDEWKAFLEAAGTDPELRELVPAFRALLLTGSRIGELVALTWGQVDLERGVIVIEQEKTRRSKALAIVPELDAILRARTRGIGAAQVFTRFGGKALRVTYLQEAFRRTLSLAELQGQHGKLIPHAVRHTAATWMGRAGVAPNRIAEVLGHGARGVTAAYTHAAAADTRDALAKLAAAEAEALRARVVRNQGTPETGVGA
jgi:integrase